MNKPLVTIIVPVYNAERYITRCLNSISNQTYDHLEIVVIDDGSIDSSRFLCEQAAVQDQRINFRSKKNEGAGYARNIGMDVANGEYILFVDSDDYLVSTCVERLVGVAQIENCDIVKCRWIEGTVENYDIQPEKRLYKKYNNVQAFRTREVGIAVCGKLLRRSVIGQIRYPRVSTHDDEFITYKLIYAANKIVVLDEIYYYYYTAPGSIMRRKRIQMPLDFVKAYEERELFFEERGEAELALITCKEHAIRLMLSYAEYNKYETKEFSKRELFNCFRQQYDKGKETATRYREEWSLRLFNMWPDGLAWLLRQIRR